MIRLMTYNIRGTMGMDNRRSAKRIADVIRKSGAQIICLQEVHQRLPFSRMVNQPKALSKYLGMKVVFQHNLSIGIGAYGNAVLTSMPIIRSCSHSLTSKGEQRGALEVIVDTPEGALTVFCTHFGLDDNERLIQGRELAAFLNYSNSPKLACGDFNEEADHSGVSELINATGLIDSDADGSPTFNSTCPSHRIDMILHDPSINVLSISTIDTQASDHLPLIADLKLPQ